MPFSKVCQTILVKSNRKGIHFRKKLRKLHDCLLAILSLFFPYGLHRYVPSNTGQQKDDYSTLHMICLSPFSENFQNLQKALMKGFKGSQGESREVKGSQGESRGVKGS